MRLQDIPVLVVLGSLVTGTGFRASALCKDPHCTFRQRLDIYKATGLEPPWTPLQMQYMDDERKAKWQPANLHSGGSSKPLPWVIPTQSSGGFVPETRTQFRPTGDSEGPERLECTSVPPFKFYLLEEALLPNCPSFDGGEGLMNLKAGNGRKLGGQHQGEVFFYMQLRNHTWRTYDPMEAQIVVVPAFLNMLAYNKGYCGPLGEGLDHISKAVLASPRYEVNKGKDFLLLSTGFVPHIMLFNNVGASQKRFNDVTRNFIYASRLNGKFIKLRSVQQKSRCVIAVPYTSPNSVAKCTGNLQEGFECPDIDQHDTFEEFMANHDYNMFLMGQVRCSPVLAHVLPLVARAQLGAAAQLTDPRGPALLSIACPPPTPTLFAHVSCSSCSFHFCTQSLATDSRTRLQ